MKFHALNQHRCRELKRNALGSHVQRAGFVALLGVVVLSGCSGLPNLSGVKTANSESDSIALSEDAGTKADGERLAETARAINKTSKIPAQNFASDAKQSGEARPDQEQLVRVNLRPSVDDHFWTESRGQTAYIGRIVKVKDGKYLLKATLIEGRSSSRVKLISEIPILRRNFGSNTGVAQEKLDNKEVWIDRNEIESIEIAD